MTNNQPHPNPKEVETWMVSLGFEWSEDGGFWRNNKDPYSIHDMLPETAAFFYTIHHTALTSFRDEVTQIDGAVDMAIKQVFLDGIRWGRDNPYGAHIPTPASLECIQQVRKAIQTISGKYNI